MEVAKVIPNGGSQAVRLPKSCRFETDEVLVRKIGNLVMLMPKDDPWSPMLSSLDLFTEDFLRDGVPELPLQERSGL